MKKKTAALAILALTIIAMSAFTALHSSGEIFYSGSPFDGGTCAQCHSGGVSIPTVTVNASPAFGSGNTYNPGTSYTLTVTVSGTYAKYGFNTEVLDSNSPGGANDAGICGPAVSANCTKYFFAGNPTNYTHNVPSGSAGSAAFSFQWTAPATGPAYIYTSGLGVDFGGSTAGDRVATYSVMLSPFVGITNYNEKFVNLTVFPNPASDNIRVNYTLAESGKVSIKLYSITGEWIQDLFTGTQGGGQQSLDAHLPENLQRGFYLLKVNINNSQTLQKLFVL